MIVSVSESAHGVDASTSLPASDNAGLGQPAIIAIGVAVPAVLLCMALVYLGRRSRHGATDTQRHGVAQVLSTSEHKKVIAGNQEFHSVREMDSMRGSVPPLRDGKPLDGSYASSVQPFSRAGAAPKSEYATRLPDFVEVDASTAYDQLTPN